MEFFKKIIKKKKAFGDKIEPNCIYCRYNSGNQTVACRFGNSADDCKKYEYDPLKRDPASQPKLKQYSEDDFSL